MRILILGATGMLGHRLIRELAPRHVVAGTVRESASAARELCPSFQNVVLLEGVVAERLETVQSALRILQPHAVVNCIGIIKQLAEANDPLRSIAVNALFPHQLANLCREGGIRLIHLSTDCVFSGRLGRPYREDDLPDPVDLYGRSKLLGEVSGPGCLTLRTSIVGRELRNRSGLVEWFISQRGRNVQGYSNALYSGFSTPTLARWIRILLENFPDLSGLWQVASDPISKYDLLTILNHSLQADISITRNESFSCDRRLDGSRFREATGLIAPDWPTMVAELTPE